MRHAPVHEKTMNKNMKAKISRWSREFNARMRSIKMEDDGLFIIQGCVIYKVKVKDRDLISLMEWSLYTGCKPAHIHAAIFEKAGWNIVRNADAIIKDEQLTPEMVLEIGIIEHSVPAILFVHPGMFEGTWPNAEEEFNKYGEKKEEAWEKYAKFFPN